jgi:hypothetical protein
MMPGSVVEAIIRKEFMTMKSKLVKIEFGFGFIEDGALL